MNYIFLLTLYLKRSIITTIKNVFDEQNFVTSKWDHEPKMGLGTTALVPL